MAKRNKYPKEQQPQYFVRNLLPKNVSQELYLESLRHSRITFCLGPAGTGKTYLAAHAALQLLFNGQVQRIVITRPIVATEDIGYLPGTLNEKIHPYLLPLLDALEDHVGPTKARDLVESGAIEVAPLAFLRGRSLNNSFILLDEAQNTTKEQMKMFLTRIGFGSCMAINGDATQSDLDKPGENGLSWATDQLTGVDPSIQVIEFSRQDIVRDHIIEVILTHLDGVRKPHR